MHTKLLGLATVALLLLVGREAGASSPCGIFARLDEISVEPDAEQPAWIMLKGDFLVVLDSGRQLAPVRGYLCFTRDALTGKDQEKGLTEWKDLRNLLKEKGQGKAFVAFGSANSEPFANSLRIWETEEQAQKGRFPYPVHHGLTKLRPATAQERQASAGNPQGRNPVAVLQDFQEKKDKEAQQKKDGKSP